ncbi:Hypothetical protein NTJ_09852 [Nesidiocoris tenuis]|uniref:Uncharacterized protein n=1 Tax=Nesidiocoris tenuis TaxID=355587 RepID=A0ABN7AZQ4_9HEMI|nr:Hypothetical protein NTJ_09852 [Nesidiocoris tenuis]
MSSVAEAILSKNESFTSADIGSFKNAGAPIADLQKTAVDRKDDLSGAASYGYGSYAYPPGGYGYGGVGYGYDPLKGLLVPLAGVALLGAAALFVSNPVLLQLGVIGGRRRRRRDATDVANLDRLKDVQILETFIEQLPPAQVVRQEKKLLANYLKCSGFHDSKCLERLVCEIQKPSSNRTAVERQVLDIVTGEMMKNEFIPKQMIQRIKKAEKLGSDGGKCDKYYCSEVDLI